MGRTMRASVLLAGLLAFSCTAHADRLKVVDDTGAPVAHAVITIAGETDMPADFGDAPRLVQKDLTFQPYVLVVPVGTEVEFPNLDRVRHHVYSFSKGNRFELELYGREEHRTVAFKKPGTVAVGCNIHDMMLAYIRVVDTPYAAVTDADGVATIEGLPAGASVAMVWQPDMMGLDAKPVPLEATGDGQVLTLPGRFIAPPAGAMR